MTQYALVANNVVQALANFTSAPAGWVAASSVPDAQLLAYYQNTMPSVFAGAYQTKILSGFTSSALGTAHTYPTDLQSQILILFALVRYLQAVQAGTTATYSASLVCQLGAAAPALQAHTAAQMLTLLGDVFTALQGVQTELYTLDAQLAAATTSAQAAALIFT